MAETEGLPGHVFISYVRENLSEVDILQAMLERAGIKVWRDKADLWPGDRWAKAIRQAITQDALVFIACFSRESAARSRSYQNEELKLAVDEMRLRPQGEPWLIPVRLSDCEIPDDDIGGGNTLRSIHWVDLFGADAEASAARLVEAVHRILVRHEGRRADSVQPVPAAGAPGPPSAASLHEIWGPATGDQAHAVRSPGLPHPPDGLVPADAILIRSRPPGGQNNPGGRRTSGHADSTPSATAGAEATASQRLTISSTVTARGAAKQYATDRAGVRLGRPATRPETKVAPATATTSPGNLARRHEPAVPIAALSGAPWLLAAACGMAATSGFFLGGLLLKGHIGLGISLSAWPVGFFGIAAPGALIRGRASHAVRWARRHPWKFALPPGLATTVAALVPALIFGQGLPGDVFEAFSYGAIVYVLTGSVGVLTGRRDRPV